MCFDKSFTFVGSEIWLRNECLLIASTQKMLRLMQNYENFIRAFFERTKYKGKKVGKVFSPLQVKAKKVFSCRAQPCLIVKSITARKVLAHSPMLPVFHRLPLPHFIIFVSLFQFSDEKKCQNKKKRKLLYEFILHFFFLLRLDKTPVKYTKGHQDNIHKFPLMRKMWQRKISGRI